MREISKDPAVHDQIAGALRSYQDTCSYLPNHVFVGTESPRSLTDPDRPWWSHLGRPTERGTFGRLFDQPAFFAALSMMDTANLTSFSDEVDSGAQEVESLLTRPKTNLATSENLASDGAEIVGREGAIGFVRHGYPDDDSLAAPVILENLAAKTTAALALSDCLLENEIDVETLDMVISCSEEAVGDRYQRGGGNLGKAVAEAVGASNASGFDIKNFCRGSDTCIGRCLESHRSRRRFNRRCRRGRKPSETRDEV